jgi:hypothetical protein
MKPRLSTLLLSWFYSARTRKLVKFKLAQYGGPESRYFSVGGPGFDLTRPNAGARPGSPQRDQRAMASPSYGLPRWLCDGLQPVGRPGPRSRALAGGSSPGNGSSSNSNSGSHECTRLPLGPPPESSTARPARPANQALQPSLHPARLPGERHEIQFHDIVSTLCREASDLKDDRDLRGTPTSPSSGSPGKQMSPSAAPALI